MFQWWRRLLDMPDHSRARVLARLAFWFIMLLLYVLGGVSLYLRARYLSPGATPVPPTASAVATVTLRSEPPTVLPTVTSLPTLTPQPIPSEEPSATVTQRPADTETPFPSPTPGLSPSATSIPATATPSLTPEPPTVMVETGTPTSEATATETATPGPLQPPPTRSQN